MSILKHSLVKGTKKEFSVENVKKDFDGKYIEKLEQNLALASLNGKNIMLTGRYEAKSYDINGTKGKYLSLECLFFNDTDITNAKLGTISARTLTATFVPVLENTLPENSGTIRQVEELKEFSVFDAIELLTTKKDGKYPYLKSIGTKLVYRIDFKENSETKRRERIFPQKNDEYLTKEIAIYEIDYITLEDETTEITETTETTETQN